LKVEIPGGAVLTQNVVAQNVLEALTMAMTLEKKTVMTKEVPNGLVVESIGSYSRTSTQSWKYWVNGKRGLIAPDRYVVHPGNTIIWKFE
jgi:hypothetical protein